MLSSGTQFIYQNARHLERAIFEATFHDGSTQRITAILRSYQNDDGGFGHALEPDLRAPSSQPLFMEFALHTLYECRLRDYEMAQRACDFLMRHADPERGVPTLLEGAAAAPRAAHWDSPSATEPWLPRIIGLVGMFFWPGVRHPWLRDAVQRSLDHIASTDFDDAHTLLTAFTLLDAVSAERDVSELFNKLAQALPSASHFIRDLPITGYGLTPLAFAPAPDAYCRPLFDDALIAAHLDALAAQQQADGGWPIAWEPPSPAAVLEWRAQRTVSALRTLRAYGRI